MSLVTGSGQNGTAEEALPQPLVVKVVDKSGHGAKAATVSWAVTSGGGSLSATSAATGDDGTVSVTWTLGPAVGAQTVAASVSGLAGSPVAFTASAAPNTKILGTITVASGVAAAARSSLPSMRPAAATYRPAPLAGPLLHGGALALGGRVSPAQPEFTPDELIVTYRNTALSAPAAGSATLGRRVVANAVGVSIRERLSAQLSSVVPTAVASVAGVSPAVLAARIHVADPSRLDEVAAALRRDPAVASVERNGIGSVAGWPVAGPSGSAGTNDPIYPYQAWHYGMIDLPAAWKVTTGSAGVLVAVVDDGIRFDHPDLARNLTSDGYDFVTDVSYNACAGGTISNAGDGNGYDPDPTVPAKYDWDSQHQCAVGPAQFHGHGVHVAGTIGAVGNDAYGTTGVNWTVRIRPVRVLGTTGRGSWYDIAQGILYAAGLPADNGAGGTVQASGAARVINLSIGGTDGASVLQAAINGAINAGALVVVSAGNDATSTPSYPAVYPGVLAVSALGPNGQLASYSNYGADIAIAAPGGDYAQGGNTDGSFGVISTMWDFTNNVPAWGWFQGTSMAAPHVAGVAALLLARNPSLTAADLRTRLTSFAVDAGASGRDDIFGAGVLNARNALTQSFEPPHQLFAQLYDAATGTLVRTTPVASDGSYKFTGVADGTYYVFAGQDEGGDQQVGQPGRRWGAFGSAAAPTTVTVAGKGEYPASFSIGLPMEREPNDNVGQAALLYPGGYLLGVLTPQDGVDVARVVVAQAGQYTFETSGWQGSCGLALEANTVLDLLDASGSVLTTNDDIDAQHYQFCSRITTSLTAGTYYLRVQVASNHPGRYRLQARAGS